MESMLGKFSQLNQGEFGMGGNGLYKAARGPVCCHSNPNVPACNREPETTGETKHILKLIHSWNHFSKLPNLNVSVYKVLSSYLCRKLHVWSGSELSVKQQG